MRTIRLILLISLCSASLAGQAQFLHLGAKAGWGKADFKAFEYGLNDYVFYFPNMQNETLRFRDFSRSDSFYPFGLYTTYETRRHFFFKLDVNSFIFQNEGNYHNSVSFANYNDAFNRTFDETTGLYDYNQNVLGYNSIKLKWVFVGAGISGGYSFFRTKQVQPYLQVGLDALYLMRFSQGAFYEDSRELRNAAVFSSLDTFKDLTLYGKLAVGVKYHNFGIEVSAQQNVLDIDYFAADYNDVLSDAHFDFVNDKPNYQDAFIYSVSLTADLFTWNLEPAGNRKKVKQLLLN